MVLPALSAIVSLHKKKQFVQASFELSDYRESNQGAHTP